MELRVRLTRCASGHCPIQTWGASLFDCQTHHPAWTWLFPLNHPRARSRLVQLMQGLHAEDPQPQRQDPLCSCHERNTRTR